MKNVAGVDSQLARIQNDLFDLGADLTAFNETVLRRITQAQITRLEQEIDTVNTNLQPLTSFILPGGTPLAAFHLGRQLRDAQNAK